MNWFNNFVAWLSPIAERPTNFGWFHLMWIAICIIATVLISWFFRNATKKQNRIILFVLWAIIFILEIYKQIVMNFDATSMQWRSYAWYLFPFQLCSTPLYILPFCFLLKEGKFQDAMFSFIGMFSIFGGLCVMAFPNDVFATDLLGIQIQTMVHHSIMIIAGVYLLVYNRKRLDYKFFLKGVYVFGACLLVALGLNLLIYNVIPSSGSFNMFYISPYVPCSLPILNMIYPKVPYAVFLLIYILGFVLASFLIFMTAKLCCFISNKIRNKKLQKVKESAN